MGGYLDPSVLSDLGASAPTPTSTPLTSPVGFPTVSASDQASRNSDSIRLMQDELENTSNPDDKAAIQKSIDRLNNANATGKPFTATLTPKQTAATPVQTAPIVPAPPAGYIHNDVLSDLSSVAQAPAATVSAATNAPPPSLAGAGTAAADEGTGTALAGKKLVGAAETGLSALTGAVGNVIGPVVGIGKQILDGKLGSPEGTAAAAQTASRIADNLTYQPRTAEGQSQSAALSSIMDASGLQAIAPDLSLAGQIGAASAGKSGTLSSASETVPTVERQEPSFGAAPKPTIPPGPVTSTPVAATPTTAHTPSIADATPEMQAAITKAQNSGTVDPDVLGRHLEADTLPVPIKLTEGQATQDPATISAEMNSRGKKAPPVAPAFYQAQNQGLIDNVTALRQQVAPDVPAADTMADHGQALIDAAKTADAPEKAAVDANYAALRAANGGDFPIDGQAFVANADAALTKGLRTGAVPSDIASSLDAFRDGSRQMTFEDFDTLNSDLGDVIRKSNNGREVGAARIIRDQLNALPLTQEAQGLQDLANTARSSAAARFAKLDADPAYGAAVEDSTPIGQVSPLADSFAKKYVIGAPSANVQRFLGNLADNPEAQQRVSAIGIDHLADAGGIDLRTRTGNFSQAGYNGALEKMHQTNKLDLVFPDAVANQQVQSLGNVARYTQNQPRGAFVNNSNTFTAAAGDLAANAAEHGTNIIAGGLPIGSLTRKGIEIVRGQSAAKRAISDAAGISK